MKNNDKNKSNLSPEELEKVSGGEEHDADKKTTKPDKSMTDNTEPHGVQTIYDTKYTPLENWDDIFKKCTEELDKWYEEKAKEGNNASLLPKEPEKDN